MHETKPLVMLLVGLVALIVLSAAAMGGMMGTGMMGGGWMMGPGGMWGYGSQTGATGVGGWQAWVWMSLGWLTMLAFWGALVAGVVLLVRWLEVGSQGPASQDSPLTILQRRYARGEIDDETYRRIRRELDPSTGEEEAKHGALWRAS